jgi:hypothetical protein
MRRAAVVLVFWGCLLGVWTLLFLAFLHTTYHTRPIEPELLGSAAAATLVAGVVIWQLDVRRRRASGYETVTSDSIATVPLAVGLAMALIGANFGLWLILIGAGMAALGIGGIVREERSRRRVRRGGEP